MKPRQLALVLLAGLLFPAAGERLTAEPAATNRPAYATDYRILAELGRDLYRELKPMYQMELSASPLWIQDDSRPFLSPYQFEATAAATRLVRVSSGFLELVNAIAHARAIDRLERGFFQRYMLLLAEGSGTRLLPEIPEITDSRYWSQDVLNEQASYVNQVIGTATAIAMAQHYLGHYDRYASQLRDSAVNPNTVAMLCTPDEWDRALKLGVGNALHCGLGVDGLKDLYAAIDAMPKRPAWTFYLLPPKANVARIRADLTRIEQNFFGR